jgi:hypothetical protein
MCVNTAFRLSWLKTPFSINAELIARDELHSKVEQRYYCFGKVAGRVVTVRFTIRGRAIRIIRAGYWRKGKKRYEEAR